MAHTSPIIAAGREATVILAEARRESEILRGEGEGERTTILNDAYGQDAGFFQFYRSMEAYRQSFDGDTSYMVLSTDSDFFRYFDSVTRDLDLPGGGATGKASQPGADQDKAEGGNQGGSN